MPEEHKSITQVLKVDAKNPLREVIKQAAQVIKNGGVVAFPTDTFYGLGANALDAQAVAAVYRAKKRQPDKPLIVLVRDVAMVAQLADQVSVAALQFMSKFWPGPLSIIFKARETLPPNLLGKGKTVAVRIPHSKIAQILLEEAGCPLTAPSANLEGGPDPMLPLQALSELNGRIDMLLDGGPCCVHYPSTLLDLTTSLPTLLREGAIKLEQLLTVMEVKSSV